MVGCPFFRSEGLAVSSENVRESREKENNLALIVPLRKPIVVHINLSPVYAIEIWRRVNNIQNMHLIEKEDNY